MSCRKLCAVSTLSIAVSNDSEVVFKSCCAEDNFSDHRDIKEILSLRLVSSGVLRVGREQLPQLLGKMKEERERVGQGSIYVVYWRRKYLNGDAKRYRQDCV